VEKFSEAFDVFLGLIRNIRQQINCALGRESCDWHLEHFCPGCTQCVPGENSLPFLFGYSLDGGSSAKRWADAGTASDWRHFDGDKEFRVRPEEVDVFKDVVKRKTLKKVKKKKGRNR
jgi:hypothetical protein